jgi:nitrogen fixation protein NifB
MDSSKHPCFNAEARHSFGRIHLPVAPKCNVQCNFCDRKFDCANESRPGVSTGILKPLQALDYLNNINQKISNLAVVGIAGPGDPFANPEETMETLELVHKHYPEKLLCISTNGLSLPEYIPRLAKLNVSHVTITVNAVDPKIGAEVYEWIHFNRKTYFGLAAAELLLQRQTEAIKLLKQNGITVKINTVVIPRVNEHHVHEVARYVSNLGADIQNCIPLIPVEGTLFGQLYEPSPLSMRGIRAKTSVYIQQMVHCARCRADAVGLLGEDHRVESEKIMSQVKKTRWVVNKPYIAVSSTNGVLIDQHLGESQHLWIYGQRNGKTELIEKRSVISAKTATNRWDEIARLLTDCSALLVSGIGQKPLEILEAKGFIVESLHGSIDESVKALFSGKPIPAISLRLAGHCGVGGRCSGSAEGCSS